jgi:DNA-binding NarL/FixJ family response regulator
MTRTAGGPVSVVIADDQAAIRDGLEAILSAAPDIVVVGVAADGAAAVDLAERHDVDVVLMDLRMPGTGGIEATRALGAIRPDISVIVLTTYADEDSVAAALDAGAGGYLTKDASHREICCAVRTAAREPTLSVGHRARPRWPAPAPPAGRGGRSAPGSPPAGS